MTVLVGYVRTQEGAAALTAGIEQAKVRDEPLIVVHAHRTGVANGSANGAGPDAPSLEQDLDAVRERMLGEGVTGEVRELPAGTSVADGLIDLMAEVDANLLVIGLRKRSPVGKLFLGSTAQRLLLEAACPVLAVKG